MNSLVLAYPSFEQNATEFVLQIDASAIALGVVLEQKGHVIAYASRLLTASERNYSVIQRECLAIVFALEQFHHYLLGWPILLNTDHAPLQWLSAQKMEGMLCRWALAMQEYDFKEIILLNFICNLTRNPADSRHCKTLFRCPKHSSHKLLYTTISSNICPSKRLTLSQNLVY